MQRVHDYAITSFPDISHLLDESGFQDVRTFNGYEARKPERLRAEGRVLMAAKRV